jgi:hypothetical protein
LNTRTGFGLEGKKSADFPAKDAVYRFLNKSTFAWRRFLLFLSAHTIGKVTRLSNHDRPKVLVLEDSSYCKEKKLLKKYSSFGLKLNIIRRIQMK